MPRRNQRDEHIDFTMEPPPTPAPIPKPRRPLSEGHAKRLEAERLERAAFLDLERCLWPFCTKRVMYTRTRKLATCEDHSFQIWSAIQADADSAPKISEWRMNRQLDTSRRIAKENAERESRAIEPGWIYYVRVTDRIKIGYSTDVRERMRAYPPHAELLAVHPGTPTLERQTHADFKGHLAEGREWFRPDEPVLQHIAQVLDQFGPPPPDFAYRFRESGRQPMRIHRRSRNQNAKG